MSSFNKRDIIVELSNRTGLTQAQALDFFEKSMDLMADELSRGNEVSVRSFGTFVVRMSKVKIGRNPKKPGSERPIPPRAVVKFRPSHELKDRVASEATPKLLAKAPPK